MPKSRSKFEDQGLLRPDDPKRRTSRSSPFKKLFLVLLGLAAFFALILWLVAKPLPEGEPGPEAEALAARMVQAVDVDAWERTGAVRWTFASRNEHLWDRERMLARVRWDDVEALVDLDAREGVARRGGAAVPPEEEAALVEEAWARWCNDSFWLNPIAKLHDPGTRREHVRLENGAEGLLVHYDEGGVTPGDSYLWIVGDDGLPVAWRMWVGIIPVGGLEVSWEGWETLPTGARVATRHKLPVGHLRLTDLEAAATLDALEPEEDPFAELGDPHS